MLLVTTVMVFVSLAGSLRDNWQPIRAMPSQGDTSQGEYGIKTGARIGFQAIKIRIKVQSTKWIH